MRVLLLGMPDVASCFDRVMRIPNLGIASLAANIFNAEVSVLDLVLHSRNVAGTVREHLLRLQPDIVGLSAMTFQYDTAKKVAAVVRQTLPEAKIVLGGYHATLAYEQFAADPESHLFDFLIRGEGEIPMNLLVNSIYEDSDPSSIPGLSHRIDGKFVHNPVGQLAELSSLNIPARRARISQKFHYFGKRYDAIETSRGCKKACSFCSIRHMYGKRHRCYSIERVISDITDARDNGAKGIFFVDDNINLLPGRFMELCQSIMSAKLNDLDYITQADVAGFVNEPDLPKAMRQAGFKGVFLGIESVSEDNWKFLRKANSTGDTQKVVQALRNNKITVAGGIIIGNPDEDAGAIRSAFRTALSLPIDHAIMWCLTPYPGTEARESMLNAGLVENKDDFRNYNGFICNIRTKHLTHKQLVRTIAWEGTKLYFNPKFFLRSRAWSISLCTAIGYFRSVSEYMTTARHNRLFASRHKM